MLDPYPEWKPFRLASYRLYYVLLRKVRNLLISVSLVNFNVYITDNKLGIFEGLNGNQIFDMLLIRWNLESSTILLIIIVHGDGLRYICFTICNNAYIWALLSSGLAKSHTIKSLLKQIYNFLWRLIYHW